MRSLTLSRSKWSRSRTARASARSILSSVSIDQGSSLTIWSQVRITPYSGDALGMLSSRLSSLVGRPSTQIVGHSLPALLGGNSDLGRVLLDKRQFQNLEMELKTPHGQRWISMAGDPIIDTAGRFEGFRGVGSDITEIRHTQERLTHLANVDVLSGLPNRGRVRQLLGDALRGATAGNVPCAIMFLDLDGFKPVNDTFGHPKGDAVLQAVAKRLCDEVAADGLAKIPHGMPALTP